MTFHTYDGQPLSVHRVYGKYNGGKLPDRDTYYSYDPGGRVVKVRHVERLKPAGATSERVDSAVISLEWNPLGQVGAVRLGTGARRTIGYDVHGWVRATGTSTRSGEFYEYIRYADDAAKPRYNGYISRREWGKLNGFSHTYDYTYDGSGFLTKASGDGNTHSVSYAYDSRGNMLSMTRRGVTDMLSGGAAAAYGVLDDVAASYSGNRLTGLAVTGGAKTFSRRTGIGRTGSFLLTYDESGRLVSDASRGIRSIGYDNDGHASSVLYSDGSAHGFTRDGLGNLTGTIYMKRTGGTDASPVVKLAGSREYTAGGHVLSNGALVMSRFGGGYFDASGNPHYYMTDWQGNNAGVVDRNGKLEQRTDYYPYGEPWLEPEATMSSGGTGDIIVRPGLSAAGDASEHNAGVSTAAVSPPESDTSVNCFLFGDKERTRTGGLNDYRFPARDYVPGFPRFTTVDPMCGGTPWLSPYACCAGNPVMYTDPSGAELSALEAAWMCVAAYKSNEDEYNEYNKAITELKESNWMISTMAHNIKLSYDGFGENGLQSVLFEREKESGGKEYAYVFAGTNSLMDLAEDVVQITGISPQYSTGINNARKIDDLAGLSELTFVGHSLGGGLGAASSMATGRKAITFNAASVSGPTKLTNRLQNDDNIVNYVARGIEIFGISFGGDPLTNLQNNIGMPASGIHIPVNIGLQDPLSSHSINTLVKYLGK